MIPSVEAVEAALRRYGVKVPTKDVLARALAAQDRGGRASLPPTDAQVDAAVADVMAMAAQLAALPPPTRKDDVGFAGITDRPMRNYLAYVGAHADTVPLDYHYRAATALSLHKHTQLGTERVETAIRVLRAALEARGIPLPPEKGEGRYRMYAPDEGTKLPDGSAYRFDAKQGVAYFTLPKRQDGTRVFQLLRDAGIERGVVQWEKNPQGVTNNVAAVRREDVIRVIGAIRKHYPDLADAVDHMHGAWKLTPASAAPTARPSAAPTPTARPSAPSLSGPIEEPPVAWSGSTPAITWTGSKEGGEVRFHFARFCGITKQYLADTPLGKYASWVKQGAEFLLAVRLNGITVDARKALAARSPDAAYVVGRLVDDLAAASREAAKALTGEQGADARRVLRQIGWMMSAEQRTRYAEEGVPLGVIQALETVNAGDTNGSAGEQDWFIEPDDVTLVIRGLSRTQRVAIEERVKSAKATKNIRGEYELRCAIKYTPSLARALDEQGAVAIAAQLRVALLVDGLTPTCVELEELATAFTLDQVDNARARAWVQEVDGALPARLAMPLMPYQTIGVTYGRATGYRFLCADEMGLGKCLTPDALVSTAYGVRPIGSFLPASAPAGFTDIPPAAGPVAGTFVRGYREDGAKPVRRITLRSGHALSGTLPHRVLVRTAEGEQVDCPLGDVAPGMWVGLYRQDDARDRPVPLALPAPQRVESPQSHPTAHTVPTHLTPELAWWLGLYLADGSATDKNAVRVTVYDPAERARQVAATAALFPTCTITEHAEGWGLFSVVVRRWLADLGIGYVRAAGKRVPPCIMEGGRTIIRAFLRGVFHDGGAITGGVEWTTASEDYAREVQVLALRLGVVLVRKPRPVDGTVYWRLTAFGAEAAAFLDKIGLNNAGQAARLTEALGGTARNTNRDVLPHTAALARAVRADLRAAGCFGRVASADPLYSTLRNVANGTANLSYAGARAALARGVDSPALAVLRDLVAQDVFWSPVESVTDLPPAEVVDVEVSDPSHRYVANGIVTHNTAQAIGCIALDPQKLLPAIVICPSSVVNNWRREFNRFYPKARVAVHTKPGELPPRDRWDVVILSWDRQRIQPESVRAWKPQLVIADEVHNAKNTEAARTKALQVLAQEVPHLIELSGTPMPNRPIELFSLLHMIDPTGFPDERSFGVRYANAARREVAMKHPLSGKIIVREFWDDKGSSNVDELRDRLRCNMIRRTKNEVAKDLPPLMLLPVPIEMTSEERAEYERIQQEWVKEFVAEKQAAGMTPAELFRALFAGGLLRAGKLRRYLGQVKAKYAILEADTFLRTERRRLLIFAEHDDVVHTIKAGLVAEGWRVQTVQGDASPNRKQKIVDEFTAGEYDVLIGTRAISEGMNLQIAASDALCVEYWWTPKDFDQAFARLHRKGQTNTVWIRMLHAEGTYDDYIDQTILEPKRRVIGAVLNNPTKGLTVEPEGMGATDLPLPSSATLEYLPSGVASTTVFRHETHPPAHPFGPDLGRAGAYGEKDSVHTYLDPAVFLALTDSPVDDPSWRGKRDAGKIEKYAARMLKAKPPATFPILWLLVREGAAGLEVTNHEGRHRAMAAIRAGVLFVPVAVVWGGSGAVPASLRAWAAGTPTTILSQGPHFREPQPATPIVSRGVLPEAPPTLSEALPAGEAMALSDLRRAFFGALEEIAGEKQVYYFGPFAIVGDRAGGILGKLEISVLAWGPTESTPHVHLAFIGVSPEDRRQGRGHRLLSIVTGAADRVGLPVDLEIDPQPDPGKSGAPVGKAGLRAFYARHGFQAVPKHADVMIRPPHQAVTVTRAGEEERIVLDGIHLATRSNGRIYLYDGARGRWDDLPANATDYDVLLRAFEGAPLPVRTVTRLRKGAGSP